MTGARIANGGETQFALSDGCHKDAVKFAVTSLPWGDAMRRLLSGWFRPPTGGPITWVVYDRPSRPPLIYPDLFVAAKWVGTTPTSDLLTGGTYRELCLKLPVGMTRRDRQPEDDPDAIEVWSQAATADRPREQH